MYEEQTRRAEAKCYKSKDGRLLEIYDALNTNNDGFDKEVTLMITFENPVDNWGAVGFKIKTYEVTASGTALVDKLEGDALRPILQCQAPCNECHPKGDMEKKSVAEDA